MKILKTLLLVACIAIGFVASAQNPVVDVSNSTLKTMTVWAGDGVCNTLPITVGPGSTGTLHFIGCLPVWANNYAYVTDVACGPTPYIPVQYSTGPQVRPNPCPPSVTIWYTDLPVIPPATGNDILNIY